MTSVKSIVATAVIAVGGTVAAFTGLHLGQAPAAAATPHAIAQPAKAAQATYTVTMTAKDLARLAALVDRGQSQTRAATHHKQTHHTQSHHKQHATHHAAPTAAQSSGGTGSSHHSETHHSSGAAQQNHDHGSGGCNDAHSGGCDDGGCD